MNPNWSAKLKHLFCLTIMATYLLFVVIGELIVWGAAWPTWAAVAVPFVVAAAMWLGWPRKAA